MWFCLTDTQHSKTSPSTNTKLGRWLSERFRKCSENNSRLEIGTSYSRSLQGKQGNSYGTHVWWLPPNSAFKLRSEYAHGPNSQGYWIETDYRLSRFGGEESLIGRVEPVFRWQQTFRSAPARAMDCPPRIPNKPTSAWTIACPTKYGSTQATRGSSRRPAIGTCGGPASYIDIFSPHGRANNEELEHSRCISGRSPSGGDAFAVAGEGCFREAASTGKTSEETSHTRSSIGRGAESL
jgi:hypothetical protein